MTYAFHLGEKLSGKSVTERWQICNRIQKTTVSPWAHHPDLTVYSNVFVLIEEGPGDMQFYNVFYSGP